MGHFKNPREIISVLSSHVDDQNDGVRNNVMRVIGETVDRAKLKEIDITPFLNALDSPYTTDRNKALLVLSAAVNTASSKKLALQKGGDKLLAILRLQQPNNHDTAYIILKKISGKDFGSTNVAAWEKWVASARASLA